MNKMIHAQPDVTDDRLIGLLTNAAQLIDAAKQERQASGSDWTQLDQEVQGELSSILDLLNKRKQELPYVGDERYIPNGDWRDQIEIHKELGEHHAPDGEGRLVDKDKWEYLGNALKARNKVFDRVIHPPCAHCSKPIYGYVIRCLDCKAALHDWVCASRHFWPNGRPKMV